MQPKFHLIVSSREGSIFEGEVESITSFNEKGKFDVLAEHANFISLIKRGLIIRVIGDDEETGKIASRPEGLPAQREINFDNALLRVRENNVEVYLGVEGLLPTLHNT